MAFSHGVSYTYPRAAATGQHHQTDQFLGSRAFCCGCEWPVLFHVQCSHSKKSALTCYMVYRVGTAHLQRHMNELEWSLKDLDHKAQTWLLGLPSPKAINLVPWFANIREQASHFLFVASF